VDDAGFTEEMARMIFKQMIGGVHCLHQNDIAHLDLKLDNFYIAEDFTLKLADFDLARSCSVMHEGLVGTRGYIAPEILEGRPWNGITVDVFSLGVILFVMVTQCYPFHEARKEDLLYKCFLNNMSPIFWKIWENRKKIQFSEGFKELLGAMWSYDPKNRPTLQQIANSPWLNLTQDDWDAYRKIMEIRYNKFSKGEHIDTEPDEKTSTGTNTTSANTTSANTTSANTRSASKQSWDKHKYVPLETPELPPKPKKLAKKKHAQAVCVGNQCNIF